MSDQIELIDVDEIDLGSGSFGDDLNSRMMTIDGNFKSIISSDFLRGSDGDSINIIKCVLSESDAFIENETVFENNHIDPITYKYLYDKVRTAIMKEYNDNDSELGSIFTKEKQEISWDKDLNGKTIYLICKENNGRKQIVSSLPFTYIDPRFTNLGNVIPQNYEGLIDCSCIVQYDDGKFVSLQSFPVLYYDPQVSENGNTGNFCWKINGQKTGLICRGPKGSDGINGSAYVAYISEKSSDGFYELYGIFQYDHAEEEYKIVSPDKFKKYGINIQEGETAICFFSTKTSDGIIKPISNPINGGDFITDYMISAFMSTNEGLYKVYAGQKVTNVLQMGNLSNLDGLLRQIGYNSDSLSCLYIPTDGTNGTAGHAIWCDEDKKAHIGLVDDTRDCTYSVSDSGVLVNHYSMIENQNPTGFNIKSDQLNIESVARDVENEDSVKKLEIDLSSNKYFDPIKIRYNRDISMESWEGDESINIKGGPITIDSNSVIETSAQNIHIQSTQDNLISGGQNIIIGGHRDNKYYPHFPEGDEPNADNNFYGSCCFTTRIPGGYDNDTTRDITFQTENGSISVSEIITWYKSRSKEFQIHPAPIDDSWITLNEKVKKHIITGYNPDGGNDKYEFNLEKIHEFINPDYYYKVNSSSIHYILENRSKSNIDLYFGNEKFDTTGYGDIKGKYDIRPNYLNDGDYKKITWNENGISENSYSPKCEGVGVLTCNFLQPILNSVGQDQWIFYYPIGSRYTIPEKSIIDIYITFTRKDAIISSDFVADITLFSSSI